MHKTNRFTFNLDPEERRLLTLLAAEARRSQGDTLCLLIRLAARKAQGRTGGDQQPLAIIGDWEVWAREADDEPF
jgi:hypothetical protein